MIKVRITSNRFGLISGRQLRAARILAGLTQRQLSKDAGYAPRAARYWEGRGEAPPSCVPSTIRAIENALAKHGVLVFSEPTPGARLMSKSVLKA